jgi:hypothetical protein
MNKVYLLIIILTTSLTSCINKSQKSDNETNIQLIKDKIDSLNNTVINDFRIGTDSCLTLLKLAEEKANKIGYLYGKANTLFNQGKLLYNKNLYTEARLKFE